MDGTPCVPSPAPLPCRRASIRDAARRWSMMTAAGGCARADGRPAGRCCVGGCGVRGGAGAAGRVLIACCRACGRVVRCRVRFAAEVGGGGRGVCVGERVVDVTLAAGDADGSSVRLERPGGAWVVEEIGDDATPGGGEDGGCAAAAVVPLVVLVSGCWPSRVAAARRSCSGPGSDNSPVSQVLRSAVEVCPAAVLLV